MERPQSDPVVRDCFLQLSMALGVVHSASIDFEVTHEEGEA